MSWLAVDQVRQFRGPALNEWVAERIIPFQAEPTYYGFSMARWLLVKNRRPSGSWPVTIQDTKRSSGFRKGSDGEVRSWAELYALATVHGI